MSVSSLVCASAAGGQPRARSRNRADPLTSVRRMAASSGMTSRSSGHREWNNSRARGRQSSMRGSGARIRLRDRDSATPVATAASLRRGRPHRARQRPGSHAPRGQPGGDTTGRRDGRAGATAHRRGSGAAGLLARGESCRRRPRPLRLAPDAGRRRHRAGLSSRARQLGPGDRHRSRARARRPCVRGPEAAEARGRALPREPRLAARAGKGRLHPAEIRRLQGRRRRALCHPAPGARCIVNQMKAPRPRPTPAPRRQDAPPAPDLTGDATARLAAVVGASDDAIVTETLDGIITSWNHAAERMYGWPASAALGRPVTLIIPPERYGEEADVLARVRGGEGVDHFETVRVTKDGHLVDISLTVWQVRDSTGRIVGASKIARDITERRRVEEERRQLLSRERGAREEAERANRAKDEFLAVVSHELRTPLNGVFGWARMLQSADVDEPTRQRALAAIVRGAAAQVRLIEDLLDVSRVVTGNLRLDLRLVDLRNVIEAALETVLPAAAAKHIEIIEELDPSPATVMGAADRLQQVLWNLLMNAVKFTPRRGRARVGLRRGETAAEITVTDSGEGIGPDVLPYVFDRFRQEDSSSTRAHAGLGLGLALVRHIVELHGGSVTAESPGKGRGATFVVRLPLAPPARGDGP